MGATKKKRPSSSNPDVNKAAAGAIRKMNGELAERERERDTHRQEEKEVKMTL